MEVWDKILDRYYFVGSKCKDCGKKHYPIRFTCGYCGSSNLEEARLSPTGKVLFGEFGINGTARGYEDAEPNLFVTVELDDGLLVDGPVVDVPPSVVAKAKLLVIDGVGNLVAGRGYPFGHVLTGFVASRGGRPDATLVGAATKYPQKGGITIK